MKILLSLVSSCFFASTSLFGGATSSGGGIDVPHVKTDLIPTISEAWFPIERDKPLTFCIEKDDTEFSLPYATYEDRFKKAFKFWQNELAYAHGSPPREAPESLLKLRRDLEQELEAVEKEEAQAEVDDYSFKDYVEDCIKGCYLGFFDIYSLIRALAKHFVGAPPYLFSQTISYIKDIKQAKAREARYERENRKFEREKNIKSLKLKIEELEEFETSPFAQPLVYKGQCSELPQGGAEDTMVDLAFMLGRLTDEQIKVLEEPKSYYAAAYKMPEASSANSRGFVYLAGPRQSLSPDAFSKSIWEQLIHTQGYNMKLFDITLLHEVGHVYGLNHSKSDRSLMSLSYVYNSIQNALNSPHLVPGEKNLVNVGIFLNIDEGVLHSNLGVFRFPEKKSFKILNPEDFGLPLRRINHVYQLKLEHTKDKIRALISVYNRPSFGFGRIDTYQEFDTLEQVTRPLSVLTEINRVDSKNPTKIDKIQLMSAEIVASTDWNGSRLVLILNPNGEISATLSQGDKSIAMQLEDFL